MKGAYAVHEVPGIGRIMVRPVICDRCLREQPITITEVALCAKGDEIDGCRLLATQTVPEPGWWMRSRHRDAPTENFCPACSLEEGLTS